MPLHGTLWAGPLQPAIVSEPAGPGQAAAQARCRGSGPEVP